MMIRDSGLLFGATLYAYAHTCIHEHRPTCQWTTAQLQLKRKAQLKLEDDGRG